MFEVIKGWINQHLSDEEAILFAAILTAFFLVLIFMGSILAPLLTGIVLAYVMQGVINFLKRYNLSDRLAFSLTYLVFLGGFIGFLFLIIPRIGRQMRLLYEETPTMISRIREVLDSLPEEYPRYISDKQVGAWIEMLNSEAGDIGQWLLSFSLAQLPVIITIVVYMMLIPFLVFFILKDKDEIIAWCVSFLPEERPLMNGVVEEMNEQMENYIRGKFVEFMIVGGVSYVFFLAFGLEYAALLGFAVGLSVIIPYLGLIAVSIPVVIIAYLQFGWTPTFFYIVLGYSIIQGIDGMILVPLLFSEANNLHPIAIIAAVLVFGSWWGLWGVFFAIPLATLVKAVMRAWPSTRRDPAALL